MFSPKHQFLRDYESSERYHLHALTIREQLLGAMHPHTARSLNNLGELYSAQERYDEAEPLLRRALHIREASLESANPDVATVLENLARLFHNNAHKAEPHERY